jgi:hypothetical protein
MTEDSVRDYSSSEHEWAWALKYKKSVIPLRFNSKAKLPFRLSSRQYIDFTDGFEEGLAKLREHFNWLKSPVGVLRELRFRLADAERELPRAREEGERTRIRQEMVDLRARIAEQERVVADPVGAAAEADKRIAVGLEVQREPPRPQPRRVAHAKFVNPPPMTAPTYFQDRHVETELLAAFLRAEDTRLMTVVGRGGVGKTAMVCRVLKSLETGQLPDDLGPLDVEGTVYFGSVAHPVSFPKLFNDLTRLLPDEAAYRLHQLFQDPRQSANQLMLALLDNFTDARIVVLLDGFEEVLNAGTLAVADGSLSEALQTVLEAPSHGVKIILTTRVPDRSLLLVHPSDRCA